MFNRLVESPPDPILALLAAYLNDENPYKINLSVGIFIDESGNTPILQAVKLAEQKIWQEQQTKRYLGVEGHLDYAKHLQTLIFGEDYCQRYAERFFTVQTPGGTAALRVAGEFIQQNWPNSTIWLSDPTWENHPYIFNKIGMPTKVYPYYDYKLNELREADLLEKLHHIPEGDVILFQACCHNPCGEDLPFHVWLKIAEICIERNLLLMFDFAYQGFAQSIDLDRLPLQFLLEQNLDFLVASSFSKNLGLYNERVGGLTVVAKNRKAAYAAGTQIKARIRSNYSNPPAHGAYIVNTIFENSNLYNLWQAELESMRKALQNNRANLLIVLQDYGLDQKFAFIGKQQGMFSLLDLTQEQIEQLRQQYSIYMLNSGRINIAGLNSKNIPQFATCLASVLQM